MMQATVIQSKGNTAAPSTKPRKSRHLLVAAGLIVTLSVLSAKAQIEAPRVSQVIAGSIRIQADRVVG
jgi:hypothetical protein